jgi:hypothetical protein
LRPAGESKFATWGRQVGGEAAALRASFFPGDAFGREFVYPKATARLITPLAKDRVPVLTPREELHLAKPPGPAVPATVAVSQTAPLLPQSPSEWATITLLAILTAVFGMASFRAPPAHYSQTGKRG